MAASSTLMPDTPATAAGGQPDASAAPPITRRRAFHGTLWILAGTLAQQAMRFASSLVLTRLLFPEAFGLAATVGLITAAVEMCSDLGVRPAAIQHPLGGTLRYLQAAWTISLARGVVLGGVIAALAWPMGWFFNEPLLVWMTLAHAVGPVLRGLANPNTLRWERDLAQGKLTLLDLGWALARIALTILAAIWLQNVWALVLGLLLGEAARSLLSYTMDPLAPRWTWDREAFSSLYRFGRFVMMSSIVGFLATRVDSLFVARTLGMERAGVYYIAVTLATFTDLLFSRIGRQILFPALSRRADDPRLLRERTAEVIGAAAIFILPGVTLLALNAGLVVRVLYDDRYLDAAAALQWLLAGFTLSSLADVVNAPLMAAGHPQFGTGATVLRLAVFCGAAPLLGGAMGVGGYAAAVAVAAAAFLLLIAVGAARNGLLALGSIAPALAVPALYAAAGLTARAAAELHVLAPPAIQTLLLAVVIYLYRGRLLHLAAVRKPGESRRDVAAP
ncbi:Lipopolysaccharide biosynthesis protein WzxC [Phycisphaerae bacterium RAS1]|nr:Lipopolysaccharide biosynthesis protein WzxC [Phycisphaerae bacterium RAS1]